MRTIEINDLANVSGGTNVVSQTIDFIDDGFGHLVPRWTVDGPIEIVMASAVFISAYIAAKYFYE
jgi:hypothetical protein